MDCFSDPLAWLVRWVADHVIAVVIPIICRQFICSLLSTYNLKTKMMRTGGGEQRIRIGIVIVSPTWTAAFRRLEISRTSWDYPFSSWMLAFAVWAH
ncbi:hypothetical protein V1504DRAFT_459967 [Lipomyces starkeyi]